MAINYISRFTGDQIQERIEKVSQLEEKIDELEEVIRDLNDEDALANATTALSLATEAKALAQEAKDTADKVEKIITGNKTSVECEMTSIVGQPNFPLDLPAGTYKFTTEYKHVTAYYMAWLQDANGNSLVTLNSNYAIGGVYEQSFTLEENAVRIAVNCVGQGIAPGTISLTFIDQDSLEARVMNLETKLN